MIRGQGAWGSFSDTADMRPPITRQPARLRKPKTLKMSAYGTFSPTARPPKGLANTVGAAHTSRSPRGRGAGKTSCTLTTERCRLQPVKAKPLRGCFASLDRFPAPSASVSFATPRRWRGVKGDEVVHFTLDALNRPNTHRRGRWIGFATCPLRPRK